MGRDQKKSNQRLEININYKKFQIIKLNWRTKDE